MTNKTLNTGSAEMSPIVQEVQGRSLWQDAGRRLLRNRMAVISSVILGIIVLLAVFAPYLGAHPYDDISWEHINSAPDWEWADGDLLPHSKDGYYFGTDSNGRDLFARTMHGARISLLVGLVATLVSLLIGVTWGATAGFLGGKIDGFMMRIVDVLYAMPFLFFVILLMVFFGRNIILIFIAIGAVEWLDMARIVRGQTLSLKKKEFIEAAHAGGVSEGRIIRRHILPNVIGPVIVYVTLMVPKVIIIEAFLSFLGLGVQEPMTSWGVLISEGAQQIQVAPWNLIFPAVFLAITLFCFNFIGDGVRDALDPKDR